MQHGRGAGLRQARGQGVLRHLGRILGRELGGLLGCLRLLARARLLHQLLLQQALPACLLARLARHEPLQIGRLALLFIALGLEPRLLSRGCLLSDLALALLLGRRRCARSGLFSEPLGLGGDRLSLGCLGALAPDQPVEELRIFCRPPAASRVHDGGVPSVCRQPRPPADGEAQKFLALPSLISL